VIHDEKIGTTPKLGFSIKSQIGSAATLFNASQSSNFIYKIVGNLTDSKISEINSIKTNSKIQDRVNAILAKAKLKFIKTESEIFQNNLVLIDSCLPEMLAELVVLFNTNAESGLSKLVNILEKLNPLHYDATAGYKFYDYKIKRLLTDIALGMYSTKVWTGQLDGTGGYLVIKENGEILCYHIYNRNEFENYLLVNTRLINPSSTRNKFGLLYKENGELFFKLNIQIRFLK
jgi:type II restriction enzyme